jgi:hypothetical protein
LDFAKGSPSATTGGVDVTVTDKATTGYTCTEITIRIVRVSDNQTLDSATFSNPGASVSKSFTGLGNNVNVRIDVSATFKSGTLFDFKDLEATVTTRQFTTLGPSDNVPGARP